MKGRLISLSRGWEVGRRVPRQDLRDYGGRLEWEQWRGEGEMAEERSVKNLRYVVYGSQSSKSFRKEEGARFYYRRRANDHER